MQRDKASPKKTKIRHQLVAVGLGHASSIAGKDFAYRQFTFCTGIYTDSKFKTYVRVNKLRK